MKSRYFAFFLLLLAQSLVQSSAVHAETLLTLHLISADLIDTAREAAARLECKTQGGADSCAGPRAPGKPGGDSSCGGDFAPLAADTGGGGGSRAFYGRQSGEKDSVAEADTGGGGGSIASLARAP